MAQRGARGGERALAVVGAVTRKQEERVVQVVVVDRLIMPVVLQPQIRALASVL